MSDSQTFCPPAYLTATHELALFQSGEDVLDNWLQDRALDNMKTGATRTYVYPLKDRHLPLTLSSLPV